MARASRGRRRKAADEWAEPPDAERQVLSNSEARRDTILAAVRELARLEAEVKAVNAEIREYKATHIKGDLGFKLADWNAIYRVSQLEVEDRDVLLDTLREGFAALEVGGSLDWVSAAEREGQPEPRRRRRQEQPVTPLDPDIIAIGKADGLAGHFDHGHLWPEGDVGHAAYHVGWAEGEKDRFGFDGPEPAPAAPRRRRGWPPRQRMEDAGLEV